MSECKAFSLSMKFYLGQERLENENECCLNPFKKNGNIYYLIEIQILLIYFILFIYF